MYKIFLCHASRHSEVVVQVGAYLKRHVDQVFMYEEHQRVESFIDTINRKLTECNVMVIFHDGAVTEFQKLEINRVTEDLGRHLKHWGVIIVPIPGLDSSRPADPEALNQFGTMPQIWPKSNDPRDWPRPRAYPVWVAREIVTSLRVPWRSIDDLPANPHLFDYEKDIIDFYIRKRELGENLWLAPEAAPGAGRRPTVEQIRAKLLDGCSPDWPATERCSNGPAVLRNPLKDVRPADGAKVVAAALTKYHEACEPEAGQWNPEKCMVFQKLTFDEARPRATLHFPVGRDLRVAILVSGGIAPGINAVIDGLVQRHWTYLENSGRTYSLRVLGLVNGFHAFDVPPPAPKVLARYDAARTESTVEPEESARHANDGGCFLGTSRMNTMMEEGKRSNDLNKILNSLRTNGIHILYVIGGDGSMKAAHALWSTAREQGYRLSVVAVPKTMDNDILWVWQSFGFLSAVEKGREVIELLHTEVSSNPRLCVVQLFGSDSGFVVSHAVLASATGQCDAALIPEVPFTMKRLAEHVRARIEGRGPIPYGLVVMAETAIPLDAEDYIDDKEVRLMDKEKDEIRKFCALRRQGKRIEGQTEDELRSAGLKIVSQGLLRILKAGDEESRLRVVANEPRHVLRSIRPSCIDIIMGQRLGTLAVDNAMAGFTDFMISQWLTEYVLVPLKMVILGRKRIPRTGIFWKSVLAKTGQEAHMYTDEELRTQDPRAYEDEMAARPPVA
jgi:6-phosphofructokinase 1